MAKNKIPLGTTCEYIICFILSFSIYDKADEEKNKTKQINNTWKIAAREATKRKPSLQAVIPLVCVARKQAQMAWV
jgi:hypothetical protein